ncbi:MAG: hypothetical protein L6435_16220 [Anaerolineae bacterium]|nr:hypothetical protein [Anaerolineae bacterium]
MPELYQLARTFALAGKPGEACRYLEEAVGLRRYYQYKALYEPDFDGIRNHELFKKIVPDEDF